MSFSAIPVLDISLARNEDTKPAFLESLRNALLDIGFLYIKNTGIDEKLTQDVMDQGKAFFDLPEEKKLEIQMKNVASFLGVHHDRFSRMPCPNLIWLQATTNLVTKSPLKEQTGVSRSTSPHPTLCPNLKTPSITISSPQTNGPNHRTSPPSVQPTRPTFPQCLPSPQISLP